MNHIEQQTQDAHQNMIDSILTMFLNRTPLNEDYSKTKCEHGHTYDKMKQFYNVSFNVDCKWKLLGTVNIDDCDLSQPISKSNTFVLNFVPVIEGMKTLQVKLEI